MTGLPKWTVTKYISDFAEQSAASFTWHHRQIFTDACQESVNYFNLKRLVTRARRATGTFKSYPNALKLIGLLFIKTAKDKNIISEVLTGEPETNLMLRIAYKGSINESAIQTDKLQKQTSLRTVIELNGEIALIYCWHILKLAVENNLVDTLIEELYLIKEISVFKKE